MNIRPLTLAAAIILSCGAPAQAARPPHHHASADASNVDALNAAAATPPLAVGARGPGVVRAQILLDRAWFSPGEIDGRFNDNLRRAVRAFQASRGLAVNGRVDTATWAALDADNAPTFTHYRVTAKDAAGPFVRIPAPMMARAQLKALDYESLTEALSERFHVSPKLLRQWNAKPPVTGADLVVPELGSGAAPGVKAHSIRIDKSDRMLYVLDTEQRTLAAFPVSIGGPRDPLPIGAMKIANEVTNPTFTYDPALLKSAPRSDAKIDIAAGPNNPVGNVWLGLSKPHWGIHGTPEPSRLGRAETNGCVHMTNWDARRLSMLVKPGFVVDVRE